MWQTIVSINKRGKTRNVCFGTEMSHVECPFTIQKALQLGDKLHHIVCGYWHRDACVILLQCNIIVPGAYLLWVMKIVPCGEQDMCSVWGSGEHVQCIHPMAGCIAGRQDVRPVPPCILNHLNYDCNVSSECVQVNNVRPVSDKMDRLSGSL